MFQGLQAGASTDSVLLDPACSAAQGEGAPGAGLSGGLHHGPGLPLMSAGCAPAMLPYLPLFSGPSSSAVGTTETEEVGVRAGDREADGRRGLWGEED